VDPVALLSQYGVLAVMGYLLVKDVGGYLLNRYLPAKPATPAAPTIPTDPASPSQHPVLDAVLSKVFGKLAVPATQTDPSFLGSLKAELDHVLAPPAPSPAAPTK
jgi:hypothetical protein